MKLLTPKQVYALYLVKGCGLTHAQAGVVMGISRSAVSHLISSARPCEQKTSQLSDGEKTHQTA